MKKTKKRKTDSNGNGLVGRTFSFSNAHLDDGQEYREYTGRVASKIGSMYLIETSVVKGQKLVSLADMRQLQFLFET
jgi:hypothetical protein